MVRVGPRATFALGRGEGQALRFRLLRATRSSPPISRAPRSASSSGGSGAAHKGSGSAALSSGPTSRKAAAHVALPSATRGCRSVLTIAGSRRSRQGGCYPVDEDLGESFNEGIERMRGQFGHKGDMLNAAFGAT